MCGWLGQPWLTSVPVGAGAARGGSQALVAAEELWRGNPALLSPASDWPCGQAPAVCQGAILVEGLEPQPS